MRWVMVQSGEVRILDKPRRLAAGGVLWDARRAWALFRSQTQKRRAFGPSDLSAVTGMSPTSINTLMLFNDFQTKLGVHVKAPKSGRILDAPALFGAAAAAAMRRQGMSLDVATGVGLAARQLAETYLVQEVKPNAMAHSI